jgi:hypothetical protein
MAQGLKSLTGGNLHAAMHRLGKAKQCLLDTSLAPPTPSELAPAGTTAVAAAAAAAATGGGGSAGVSLGGLTTDASSQGIADDTADSVGTTDRTEDKYADAQSKQQHRRQPESAAAAEAVSRAVQLATVCGCLGDCYQRVGQPEQADQQYRESVAAVQPYSEDSAEAAHAMSVSLNK